MKRSPLLALPMLLLAVSCVQDVYLGLSDTGVGEDAVDGSSESSTDAGGGPSYTCNQPGIECVAACAQGVTPRPDLTCEGSSVCCSTEQTACIGDALDCSACGLPRAPRCDGTEWTCDAIACPSCRIDAECGDHEFCKIDSPSLEGRCFGCPPREGLFCDRGTIVNHQFGNQCQYAICDCPGGTSQVEGQGCVGAGGWLDIDPATITFFALPIDSLRYAVSGLDRDARTCVTIVWPLDSVEDAVSRCGETDPYVVLTRDTDGPCGQWDYAGNAVTDSADGCYDFADFSNLRITGEPHLDLVDMELMVSGGSYTGGVRMSNRAYLEPPPVSIVIERHSPLDDNAYVQEIDFGVRQSWAHLFYNDVEIPIGPGCTVLECGEDARSCPSVPRRARTVKEGTAVGSVALTWDGFVYLRPTGEEECFEREAAHPGSYVLQTCYGRRVESNESSMDMVVTPDPLYCPSPPYEFRYPTPRVGWTNVSY